VTAYTMTPSAAKRNLKQDVLSRNLSKSHKPTGLHIKAICKQPKGCRANYD